MNNLGDWNKELPEWDDARTNKLLRRVQKSFNPGEFPHLTKITSNVYAFSKSKCTYRELYIRIVGLRETMEAELTGRKLVHISDLNEKFCDNDDLLGAKVANAFPSAIPDIRDAGNCYAVGLNTACVFHLMRVLEEGLRVLAKDLGVQHETENWGRVVEQIETALSVKTSRMV